MFGMGKHFLIGGTIGVVLALAGCSSPEGRYLDALEDGGVAVQRVPTGSVAGATAQMGYTVCDRLADGQPPDLVVIQVGGIRLSHDARFTPAEARIIVSSAVAELCPQHEPTTIELSVDR